MSHTPCGTSFAIAIVRALRPAAQAQYALRACHRYDEEAARRWFGSKKTSPLTGATLTDTTLVSNFAIKKQIDAYLEVCKLAPLPDARRALAQSRARSTWHRRKRGARRASCRTRRPTRGAAMASIRISSARSERPRAGRSARSVVAIHVAIAWPTHDVRSLASPVRPPRLLHLAPLRSAVYSVLHPELLCTLLLYRAVLDHKVISRDRAKNEIRLPEPPPTGCMG